MKASMRTCRKCKKVFMMNYTTSWVNDLCPFHYIEIYSVDRAKSEYIEENKFIDVNNVERFVKDTETEYLWLKTKFPNLNIPFNEVEKIILAHIL